MQNAIRAGCDKGKKYLRFVQLSHSPWASIPANGQCRNSRSLRLVNRRVEQTHSSGLLINCVTAEMVRQSTAHAGDNVLSRAVFGGQ